MKKVRGKTSSRRQGHGASESKQAADTRALALASTIRKLMAAGFVSQSALVNALNQRGIPAARGGIWHRTAVVRMLARLGLITSGKGRINNGLASKRVADVRAESFGPTIRKLRKAGFVSINAIARELNKREISTARGGKWHLTSVSRLLRRLNFSSDRRR
jgi:hypothetical protein